MMLWRGSTLTEGLDWAPVHGGRITIADNGWLVFGDSERLDWQLMRWTDPRLDGARVKISVAAIPKPGCDTSLYVHHWGGEDVCLINRDGAVIRSNRVESLDAGRKPDGRIAANIIFRNEHATLSLGTAKATGRYLGSGTDQYSFENISVELLPINPFRELVIGKLWQGEDVFRSFPSDVFQVDLQGWNNSRHPYLREAIAAIHPTLVVEIGVWKGASTVFMASELRSSQSSAAVVAVDTWLGSSEHFVGPHRKSLGAINGYPTIFYKFLANVVHENLTDYVVPLPLDSQNAAQVLIEKDLRPDLIHLDGGHDYNSVISDLRTWWPLLTPGGMLVGDDYYTNGVWPGVKSAFDDFFRVAEAGPLENSSGKCRIRKTPRLTPHRPSATEVVG